MILDRRLMQHMLTYAMNNSCFRMSVYCETRLSVWMTAMPNGNGLLTNTFLSLQHMLGKRRRVFAECVY